MDPTAANIKDGSLEKYSGKKVLIVTSVLIPLQLLCVTLRCYVRYRSKISFGLDDTVVGLAMLGQLAWAGVIIGAIKNSGMGYHTLYLEQLNPSLIISASKYRTAEAFLYIPNANMPKISILLLYRRIFATHTLRVACDIFIAILVADIVICTVVLFFMCRPFAANWDPTIPGAKCMDIVAIYTWGSLPNIISDVAILLFPMPAVWSLQTILRTKFQLTITFALSSFGLIVSILRFKSFFVNQSNDFTWIGSHHGIWGQAEPAAYLICACIITFKPLCDSCRCKGRRDSAGESG